MTHRHSGNGQHPEKAPLSEVPRIDLHRHLDGNIRLSTVIDLARQHGIRLPADDEAGLRPYVTITEPQPGLLAFLEKFQWSIAVLADEDACRRVAFENVEDAWREGLDYVELRFSPWFMAQPHHLDPSGVVAAVVKGVEEGRKTYGTEVRLIGILSRTFGPETCARELDALLDFRQDLVAIDLAGDEQHFPARLFQKHFERVREAGLGVTIHAGEAAGPESIREALEILRATRIGHGLAAISDPDLMDVISMQRVGLECCLTSNVQTSAVRAFADHPLRAFLERGLLATINTDDPGISGITLDHEWEIAAPAAGLTEEHIRQAALNAQAIAFDFPSPSAISRSF